MVRLLNYSSLKHALVYACAASLVCANLTAGCCCNQHYDCSDEPSQFESSFYARDMVDQAMKKMEEGKMKEAIKLLENVIEKFYPNNVRLYLDLAHMYAKDGRKADAIETIQNAITLCEGAGITEQIYADCLFFYASLIYRQDIEQATKVYKNWQIHDRFQFKVVNHADGSYSQIFPDNMLTDKVRIALINMLVSEGFCESPSDIKFEGDTATIVPSYVKKNSKSCQIKAFDWCEASCDQAAIAMAMGCNCIQKRTQQFLCLSATQAFLRKCYNCCEDGFGNCINSALESLPRSPSHWLTNE